MSRFEINETTLIDAPIDRVFDTLVDFTTWPTWSPWMVADPDCTIDIDQHADSVGSVYRWNGDVSGQGQMKRMVAERPTRIADRLEIIKPFKSQSDVAFDLADRDGSTEVTWRMAGNWPWFLFWMKSKMLMLIGKDYERGLKRLKWLVEKGEIPAKVEIQSDTVRPDSVTVLGLRGHCPWDGIEAEIDQKLAAIRQSLDAAGIEHQGMIATMYENVDLKVQTFDYVTGYLVSDQTPTPDDLARTSIGGVPCLHIRHLGSYQFLDDAWTAIYQIARHRKTKVGRLPGFEINRNDPKTTDEADLVTDLYLPVG